MTNYSDLLWTLKRSAQRAEEQYQALAPNRERRNQYLVVSAQSAWLRAAIRYQRAEIRFWHQLARLWKAN